jgi:hypothetical protein
MGRVALDMGSTIPFGKSVEDHGGIDQSGDCTAEEDDEKGEAKRTA